MAIGECKQQKDPFRFTTEHFFQLVRAHLTPPAVSVVPAERTNSDFRLVEALAQTMHAVFPNVYIIDTARFENSVIIGTNARTSLDNFQVNTRAVRNPLAKEVAAERFQSGKRGEEKISKVYFT